MGAKEYSIAFMIAGKLSGAFSNTFKKANETVNTFNKQLSALNRDSANMDGLIKARKEVAYSSREYIQAKQKVAELGRAMSATSEPTSKMVADFNRAKAAVEKSKASLERKRSALRELDASMGTTGTHLQTLIQRQNALASATDRARVAQEKLARTNEKLQSAKAYQGQITGNAMASAGALGAMAASATGTAGIPVKQAMSFENQQAELRKFSDEYKEVFSGIQNLSLKYAKSTEDMTAMASNAFQSGIAKNAKEALKLVEIQNQMAIAFDMTGDEVGASFADIQGKMGLTIDQSQELFDIVNQIGNTTNASSKDIVEVLARSGGALTGLTKMSSKQVAALAGSFRSASVSSEVASTSMMSFINAMTAGSGATKAQREGFEKLGMDVEKVSKMMTSSPENAQKAIQDVLARINKLPDAEKSGLIGKIFGNEAGLKSAVATLAKQTQLVANNFDLISNPTEYAGSMLKEYQSRADTTSNSLEIMSNAVKLVSGGIGMALLPAVRSAAESFVANSAGIIEWVNNNQALILSFMKVAGVVVGSVAGFHALRIVFALLASPIISMYRGYLNIQKAIMLMRNSTVLATVATKAQAVALGAWKLVVVASTTAAKLMRGSMLLLNAAMRANPVGLVITAFTLLVGAGIALYKNWDTVKAKTMELWNSFSSKFPNIASVVKTNFGIVVGIAKNVWGVFSNLIGFVKNVFTGQWSAAWENVKGIFSNTFNALIGIAKAPLNSIIGLVNGAIGAINGISVDIPYWVPKFGGQSFGVNIPKIPQLAEGGIATRSTLANIGEGGEPEAVIPLSKLSQMLGSGVGFGGGITVNFAPVINVSGGSGSAYEDVKRGLDEGRRQFEKDLKRLMDDKRRLSFA